MKPFEFVSKILSGAGVAALALGLMALSDKPSESKSKLSQCVQGPFENTQVIDEKTLLIEGRGSDFAVLKVSGCRLTDWDPVQFVFHGTNSICSAIDADLSVLEGRSFPIHCFVDSMTPISRDEAKAMKIAPKDTSEAKRHH